MAKKKRQPWWKKLLNNQWLPEVLVVGGLLLVAFLLLVPSIVTSTLLETLQAVLSWVQSIGKQLLRPTNFIAFLIIIGLVIFFIRRLRYHLLRLAPKDRSCPVCNHRIRRRHRKSLDRLMSYFVPVRRYSCSNCNWKGLLIYNKQRD